MKLDYLLDNIPSIYYLIKSSVVFKEMILCRV